MWFLLFAAAWLLAGLLVLALVMLAAHVLDEEPVSMQVAPLIVLFFPYFLVALIIRLSR